MQEEIEVGIIGLLPIEGGVGDISARGMGHVRVGAADVLVGHVFDNTPKGAMVFEKEGEVAVSEAGRTVENATEDESAEKSRRCPQLIGSVRATWTNGSG